MARQSAGPVATALFVVAVLLAIGMLWILWPILIVAAIPNFKE